MFVRRRCICVVGHVRRARIWRGAWRGLSLDAGDGCDCWGWLKKVRSCGGSALVLVEVRAWIHFEEMGAVS